MSAASAIVRRTLGDARTRTTSFAALCFVYAWGQVAGYAHSYPDVADRLQFARSFGDNRAVRLFYGTPHDLTTDGGYAAWRVGGLVAILLAVWGLLSAIAALRGEEDTGRAELVLSGIAGRGRRFAAVVAAIALGAAALWLALALGLMAGGLPAGGSAFLALATVSTAAVFAGVGALASQLAPTRRLATEGASGALVLALALRVVADTASSFTDLRWVTPFGWAEELRPFTGARPAVLLLPLAVTAALLILSAVIEGRRDIGRGLLSTADRSAPRLRLLGSPAALAARSERGSLLAWLAGIGFFAFIVGLLSSSVSSLDVSANLQRQLDRLGIPSITTASGYLGFTFLIFVFALSLFACAQVAALRRDEAEQRLETLLALPVGRRHWLAGRLGVGAGAMVVLALTSGVLAWAGARTQGAEVSFLDLVGAGANTLPAAALFLGLGALAYAAVPRAGAGIAYAVVSLAFVWELFGALLGAPAWTLDLTPFHHVGLVPAASFDAGGAAVMVALAAAAAVAALEVFRRRDLTGV